MTAIVLLIIYIDRAYLFYTSNFFSSDMYF